MQLLLQWQTMGPNVWMESSVCDEQDLIGKRRESEFCSSNPSTNCSCVSTSGVMSRNIAHDFVYRRKKHCSGSVFTSPINQPADIKPSDGCNPAISSDGFISKYHTEAMRSCSSIPDDCNGVGERCINGFLSEVEDLSEHTRASKLNDCSVINTCWSSRSDSKHSAASLKVIVDDGGECSSSGAGKSLEMSEKDICIAILKNQGMLDEACRVNERASSGTTETSSDYYCWKSCKICDRRDSTKNMLICDTCDDAFHRSCCTPRIKILPVGEWLCNSCLKLKRMELKHKCTSNGENGVIDPTASDTELSSLRYMLWDTEPYMSNVRIGDKYQADVPVWHGPDNEVYDPPGVPLDIDPSDFINSQETDSFQPVKLNSIGNWIQCHESIDCPGEGSDRVICGKWRRAPLFEVQTDNWECFRCILWDPSHADCAVPQEAEIEEVMKQMKYLQMLRPRLTAKRRKMDHSKHTAAKENLQQ